MSSRTAPIARARFCALACDGAYFRVGDACNAYWTFFAASQYRTIGSGRAPSRSAEAGNTTGIRVPKATNFDANQAPLAARHGPWKKMEPALFQSHGFVDKYIDDAIMAIFPTGADDALRAGCFIRMPKPRTVLYCAGRIDLGE
jgi:hypothetical protein